MKTANPDVEVDAAIMEIATAFGIHTDRVSPIVDRYGVEASLLALKSVQDDMAGGFQPTSAMAVLSSLLGKGTIQAGMVAAGTADAELDFLFDRYHRGEWLQQRSGVAGPGSCKCCPDGGPYAGKAPPGGEPEEGSEEA